MNRLGLVTLASLISLCAHSAWGATVTYTLEIDPSSTTWSLFGQSSAADNAGISLWGASLLNVNFPVTIQAPNLKYLDQSLNAHAEGFSSFFETFTVNPIGSSQDDVVIYGFGQAAGTLTLPANASFLSQRNASYAAKLLLATGTYSGIAPSFKPGGSATDFPTEVFNLTQDTTFFTPSLQFVTNTVPEPSGILMLIPLAAFAKRRRTSIAD